MPQMVLNYGYLTLFASAFPLASLLSVIGHVVEMKSDLCKMLFLLRRFVSRTLTRTILLESC